MAKLTKRQKSFQGKVDSLKLYGIDDAFKIVQDCAIAKFDESIDVAVQLGIDAKKSDQVVRGAVVMPNGTGKTKRVAVFAQGVKADEARAAGADIVGMEDLAEQVKAGNLNFDVVIASPDTMRIVGTLGQILGPRGLMPNPKVGTVTPDVAQAVRNAKAGQVQFRVDKAGIVHATVGRRSFDADKLKGNLQALIEALNKSKPATSKGIYLRKVAVSSTMGVGVRVDIASINAASGAGGPDQSGCESMNPAAARKGRSRVLLNWWATAPALWSGSSGAIKDRWCGESRLSDRWAQKSGTTRKPTQMAHPLEGLSAVAGVSSAAMGSWTEGR
jgi:large subunit ribosomal protein L1